MRPMSLIDLVAIPLVLACLVWAYRIERPHKTAVVEPVTFPPCSTQTPKSLLWVIYDKGCPVEGLLRDGGMWWP